MSSGLQIYLWGAVIFVALIVMDVMSNSINISGNGVISLKNKFKKNERTKKKDIPNSKD